MYYKKDENLLSYSKKIVVDWEYYFKNYLKFPINKHIYVKYTHILTRLLLLHNISNYHIICT